MQKTQVVGKAVEELDRVLTDRQVQQILSISRSALWRLRESNLIRARKMGTRVVYLESDIREFLSKLPIANEEVR